jgi:hypothetical protein
MTRELQRTCQRKLLQQKVAWHIFFMKQERITSTGYILKKGIMYIQDPKTKTKEKTKRNKTKAALLNDILQS